MASPINTRAHLLASFLDWSNGLGHRALDSTDRCLGCGCGERKTWTGARSGGRSGLNTCRDDEFMDLDWHLWQATGDVEEQQTKVASVVVLGLLRVGKSMVHHRGGAALPLTQPYTPLMLVELSAKNWSSAPPCTESAAAGSVEPSARRPARHTPTHGRTKGRSSHLASLGRYTWSQGARKSTRRAPCDLLKKHSTHPLKG